MIIKFWICIQLKHKYVAYFWNKKTTNLYTKYTKLVADSLYELKMLILKDYIYIRDAIVFASKIIPSFIMFFISESL